MIDGKLKTLENLVELLYNELTESRTGTQVCDKTYKLLKEAALDSIDLKRKIELARGWQAAEDKAKIGVDA